MEKEHQKRRKRRRRAKFIEVEVGEVDIEHRLKLEHSLLTLEYALSKLEHRMLVAGIKRSRLRKTDYIARVW